MRQQDLINTVCTYGNGNNSPAAIVTGSKMPPTDGDGLPPHLNHHQLPTNPLMIANNRKRAKAPSSISGGFTESIISSSSEGSNLNPPMIDRTEEATINANINPPELMDMGAGSNYHQQAAMAATAAAQQQQPQQQYLAFSSMLSSPELLSLLMASNCSTPTAAAINPQQQHQFVRLQQQQMAAAAVMAEAIAATNKQQQQLHRNDSGSSGTGTAAFMVQPTPGKPTMNGSSSSSCASSSFGPFLNGIVRQGSQRSTTTTTSGSNRSLTLTLTPKSEQSSPPTSTSQQQQHMQQQQQQHFYASPFSSSSAPSSASTFPMCSPLFGAIGPNGTNALPGAGAPLSPETATAILAKWILCQQQQQQPYPMAHLVMELLQQMLRNQQQPFPPPFNANGINGGYGNNQHLLQLQQCMHILQLQMQKNGQTAGPPLGNVPAFGLAQSMMAQKHGSTINTKKANTTGYSSSIGNIANATGMKTVVENVKKRRSSAHSQGSITSSQGTGSSTTLSMHSQPTSNGMSTPRTPISSSMAERLHIDENCGGGGGNHQWQQYHQQQLMKDEEWGGGMMVASTSSSAWHGMPAKKQRPKQTSCTKHNDGDVTQRHQQQKMVKDKDSSKRRVPKKTRRMSMDVTECSSVPNTPTTSAATAAAQTSAVAGCSSAAVNKQKASSQRSLGSIAIEADGMPSTSQQLANGHSMRSISSTGSAGYEDGTNTSPTGTIASPGDGEKRTSFCCEWDSCTEQFGEEDTFVAHVNTMHVYAEKSPHFYCRWSGCTRDQPFNAQYMLAQHVRKHSGEKPYLCEHEDPDGTRCMKRYSRLENLKTHQRSHTGDRPYECAHCKKTFTNASDKAKHQNRTHNANKEFACPVFQCPKCYTDPSSLRKHVLHEHGEPVWLFAKENKEQRHARNYGVIGIRSDGTPYIMPSGTSSSDEDREVDVMSTTPPPPPQLASEQEQQLQHKLPPVKENNDDEVSEEECGHQQQQQCQQQYQQQQLMPDDIAANNMGLMQGVQTTAECFATAATNMNGYGEPQQQQQQMLGGVQQQNDCSGQQSLANNIHQSQQQKQPSSITTNGIGTIGIKNEGQPLEARTLVVAPIAMQPAPSVAKVAPTLRELPSPSRQQQQQANNNGIWMVDCHHHQISPNYANQSDSTFLAANNPNQHQHLQQQFIPSNGFYGATGSVAMAHQHAQMPMIECGGGCPAPKWIEQNQHQQHYYRDNAGGGGGATMMASASVQPLQSHFTGYSKCCYETPQAIYQQQQQQPHLMLTEYPTANNSNNGMQQFYQHQQQHLWQLLERQPQTALQTAASPIPQQQQLSGNGSMPSMQQQQSYAASSDNSDDIDGGDDGDDDVDEEASSLIGELQISTPHTSTDTAPYRHHPQGQL